ncbi:MAG: hypothetical protein WCJ93_06550 [Methanomicrobiales archaeon]
MKRKLCPFDKLECVGEPCMLFSLKEGNCGLALHGTPAALPVQYEKSKPPRDIERGDHERKSRFKAELFD